MSSFEPRFRDTRSVRIRDGLDVGGDQPLFLIAGPCGIESRGLLQDVAGHMVEVTEALDLPLIFKSSYDKANRTSIDSFRGPGLERGLKLLEEVRETFDVPVTSDVHCSDHPEPAAGVLDLIQIPAFLCRQTDLLLAAAKTGRAMNVKKGQFLDPADVHHIADKAASENNRKVMFTERGTCFGYGDLVNDVRAIPIMQSGGAPVVYDITHSAQQPRGGTEQTGGTRKYMPEMARAAVAAGCNGLFMEVHPDPDRAKSDAATQFPLEDVRSFLEPLLDLRRAM